MKHQDNENHPLEKWRRKEQAKRRDKHFPRKDACTFLGIWPSQWSQIVNDGQKPSAEVLLRIRERTGISADEILDACLEVAGR